ncbi:RNA-binding protein 34 isoform X2 [Gouania willdenowi]|uniref:RRM domain-containing protein n=1 Tax=Gouania willdenowi TaxID=441366 RepID=A0A8C5HM08_GOUWI|nr:RNA-binding protein 34 isoform X2 [Gouania willdenowi]
MKKKPSHSEDASLGQQSADYTVGQVSGSLLQNCPAASGSLFALFSTPAPAASLVFQAAPKHVKKSTDTNDHPKLSPEANDEICVKKKNKKLKDKCAADHSLKNRESTFQDTDEDLKGEVQSTTKRKRTVSNTEEEKDATYWVMKRQKLRANREEETVKSKKTVFVGNLPISCSKKTLRSIFRDTGPIESIRFRSLVREDPSMSRKLATIRRQVHPKKQSINAYVVFKEEGGATKALQRNGLEVEKDFHIRVDRVTGSSSQHDHKCSVFVGNLPFDITEVALRKHFEVIGAVEAVRLVRDQNTGMGKGFGYVLFKSADYVQLALELNGSKLAERSIRVMRSVKKEKNKKKMDSKGASKRAGKSPTKDSRKGSSSEAEARRGGFRSQRKFTGKQQFTKRPSSFKGEMVDPSKKTKKKGLKKKKKPTKCVHIVGANP